MPNVFAICELLTRKWKKDDYLMFQAFGMSVPGAEALRSAID